MNLNLLIIPAAVLVFNMTPLSAHAELSGSGKDWREFQRLCQGSSALAESIMTRRQAGDSMESLMTFVADMEMRSLGETLVTTAYEFPRYPSKEDQKRTVEEFRDIVYGNCVKSLKEELK